MPWYKQTKYIILLLILVFPVGLYFTWRYTNWPTRTKKFVSYVGTGLFLLMVVIGAFAPTPQTSQEAITAPKTAEMTPSTTSTGDSAKNADTTPSASKSPSDSDAIFEAAITCQEYAESYFKVKDVNISHDQSTIERKQDNGTILIKANIADSQGTLRQEKPLGTMECTASVDGMTVTNFLAY